MTKHFVGLSALLLLFAVTANTQLPPPTSDTLVKSEKAVFEKPEVEPSVNVQLWRQHLKSQLRVYIENAAVRGMKAGQYTVNVRFLVEKDGRITDAKALNAPGYGLAIGAVRTVRTGPRRTAGEVNRPKSVVVPHGQLRLLLLKSKAIVSERKAASCCAAAFLLPEKKGVILKANHLYAQSTAANDSGSF